MADLNDVLKSFSPNFNSNVGEDIQKIKKEEQKTGLESLLSLANKFATGKTLSTLGAALSLGAKQNQGQMVSGIYVPGALTPDIGGALVDQFNKDQILRGNSIQDDQIKDKKKQQELENKRIDEDRDFNKDQTLRNNSIQDDAIAYGKERDAKKDALVDDEISYTRGQNAQDRAERTEDRAFNKKIMLYDRDFRKRLLESKALDAQKKQLQEDKQTELTIKNLERDRGQLMQTLAEAQPYLGAGLGNKLKRGAGWVVNTEGNQALANAEASLVNFMSRNIRNLGGFDKGPITDDDFRNALKGAFDVNASLETNLQNINNISREMMSKNGVELPESSYLTIKDFEK